MGNATWDRNEYATRSATIASASREQIFTKHAVESKFDPRSVTIRESVDSESNPVSNPIIIGLDVTGSMGIIAEKIAKKGLGTLIEGILDRKPVTDPHIMIMAIGDVFHDHAPLQVTQFEADIRIAEQLSELWLEGGGGGNSFESYDLPWAFAARKTKIDSFDKRGVKGYLFTIGDENPPLEAVSSSQLKESIGAGSQGNSSTIELLAEAQEKWNVFHVIVEQGDYARRALSRVSENWKNLLGRKAIHLNDYDCIAEVILSVIEVNEGADPEEVIKSWENTKIRNAVEYALFGKQ
jgi:hypothetical protein